MRDDFFVNGVDGATGDYLPAPAVISTAADARSAARAEALGGVMGLPYGARPLDLASVGWALVTHPEETAMLEDALEPLLAQRRERLGGRAKQLRYEGQTRRRWLAEHGVGGSDIDPDRVPYYLLFAGSPQRIPFRLLHELAIDYVVGYLELDGPDDYRRYAESVVTWEEKPSRATPRVSFFGPRNDSATFLSADHLLTPLAQQIEGTSDIGDSATKPRLRQILRDGVDVLFTASHGIGFPAGDPRQTSRQGALVCQEWPGPGTIDEDHYFAAADVPEDAKIDGLISFHFACYGAGTPISDRFYKRTGEPAKVLAEKPFVSALAKRFLRNGALAFAGHVDRAWSFSIVSAAATEIAPFRNFLDHVLAGEPVGYAMRDFADRFATYSVELLRELERNEYEDVDPKTLRSLWTQVNDAEAYLVIGDPAVHL